MYLMCCSLSFRVFMLHQRVIPTPTPITTHIQMGAVMISIMVAISFLMVIYLSPLPPQLGHPWQVTHFHSSQSTQLANSTFSTLIIRQSSCLQSCLFPFFTISFMSFVIIPPNHIPKVILYSFMSGDP